MKTTRCLTIAFLVFLPFLLAAATLSAAAERCSSSPAGTWTIKVDFNFIADPSKPDETVKFYLQNLQNFTADGRTTSLLATGEGHPNVGDTRVGCMGDWKPRGHRGEFDLVMRCLYNQAWDGVYGEIRGTGRVLANGKLWAKFTYIDYNGDGSVFWDEGAGVMLGTRIQ